MADYMIVNGELYHHGVKGMKWGVHKKKQPVSDTRKKMDTAKQKYKDAKKAYSKSYNKAYRYSATHPISQWGRGKNGKEADRRWEDAVDKARNAEKAKKAYKDAKRTRKSKIASAYKKVKANSSAVQKIMFNAATRKRAAKYMVDNDMRMGDAIKKANKDAIRNTMAFVGAFGAIAVANRVYK